MRQQNPTENKLRDKFNIKPFYTTPELKKLIHLKTNHGTIAFLKKLGLKPTCIGRKFIWYLSDIQTYTPSLFASLCEAAELKQLQSIDQLIDMDFDDSSYLKNQFR